MFIHCLMIKHRRPSSYVSHQILQSSPRPQSAQRSHWEGPSFSCFREVVVCRVSTGPGGCYVFSVQTWLSAGSCLQVTDSLGEEKDTCKTTKTFYDTILYHSIQLKYSRCNMPREHRRRERTEDILLKRCSTSYDKAGNQTT